MQTEGRCLEEFDAVVFTTFNTEFYLTNLTLLVFFRDKV
jgi:hypothetical protein